MCVCIVLLWKIHTFFDVGANPECVYVLFYCGKYTHSSTWEPILNVCMYCSIVENTHILRRGIGYVEQ